MINNYTFKKNITKRDLNYFLELNIPSIFNNFLYKICGNKGFYNYGKYSSNNSINSNNNLLIEIDKVQILVISITFKGKEYFDFLNMHDAQYDTQDDTHDDPLDDDPLDDDSYKKNIKINIERKHSTDNIHNILSLNNRFKLIKKEEEDDDEDDEDEDDEEDEEDEDDEEDKDDEENKDEDDEENKDEDDEEVKDE